MIIARMVINMNEARLSTIEQIEPFLSASSEIEFLAAGDDGERGVLLRPLQYTSDYSRAQ